MGPEVNGCGVRCAGEKGGTVVHLNDLGDVGDLDIIENDVGGLFVGVCQDADWSVGNGGIDYRDGANALSCGSSTAADVEGNGAVFDFNLRWAMLVGECLE